MFNLSTSRARRSRILAAVLAAPLLATAVTAADAAYILRAAGGLPQDAAPAAPTTPPPAPQAVLVLSSANVDFGSVAVTASATSTVTLSNTGLAAGAVAVTDPGAPFSVAHNCPAELAPAANCTLTFTFSPTATGNATGSSMAAGQAVVLGGYGNMLLVTQIAASSRYTVALKNDGTLWATGDNYNGQLGLGDTANRSSFTRVLSAGTDVAAIAAGGDSTLVLKTGGALWVTGNNAQGQLGLGDNANRMAFTQVASAGTDVVAIAAGGNHTLVLKPGGALWAAGANTSGQLGFGDTAQRTSFTRVLSAGADVVAIAAGGTHTLVLKAGGTLWAAGFNAQGQLGLGDTANRMAFTQVASAGSDVTSIAAGGYHTVVLKTGGALWATGSNAQGQLGLGDTTQRTSFTQSTSAGTGGISIAAGDYHTLALKTGGTLWATGSNGNGQIGLGGTMSTKVYTQVTSAGTGATSIATGAFHALVLKSDGTLGATGYNGEGQLGLGNNTSRSTFGLVP